MSKKLFLLIFIFVGGALFYIGYYSLSFPFLRYNKFSKPITKEVFVIDEFLYDSESPNFFTEVNRIAKQKWYDDARMSWVRASHLQDGNMYYLFTFVSDSNLLELRNINKTLKQELAVFYGGQMKIDSFAVAYFSDIIPKTLKEFLRNNSFLWDWVIRAKFHNIEGYNNKMLIGVTCPKDNLCYFFNDGVKDNIDPKYIKITGTKAWSIYDNLAPKDKIRPSTIFLRDGRVLLSRYQENYPKADFMRRWVEQDTPFNWMIGGMANVNATTGEICISDNQGNFRCQK